MARTAPDARSESGRRAEALRAARLGRILVVEDEPDVADLIRHHLSRDGYDVVVSANGAEALRHARAGRIDAVLLDIMVPQLNGWEICRRLKHDAETRALPVIMVTGRVEEGDKVVGFELGADDYVTKPFSPRELVARPRAVLRRGKSGGTPDRQPYLKVGDLEIDRHRFEVRRAGRGVEVTPNPTETATPHTEPEYTEECMKRVRTVIAALLGLVVATTVGAAEVKVDPELPAYKAVSGVSGNISSIGSDTLNNLMTYWAEHFAKFYPNAKVQIEGKGSSTAPPALISGTAQLGPMSRAMKGTEIDQFEKKYGYKPTAIRTSVDALAVFVNKDNPIKCLSITQVDAIFSKSRRQGGKDDVKTWGQVGLTGEWAARPISLYGRNSASGTYGFFKEHTMKNGDFKDTVKEQPGSASVVQGVTVDRFAMGYSGIGYATAGVRAVPLAEKDGAKCVEATADNSYAGTYPLARFLYVYVNKAPGKPIDPLTREFVKLVLSRDGQQDVVKDGYFPIPASVAREELNKVQ